MWSPASSAAQPYAFTGMARVGLDVATGWYTASGGPQCYWEISEDADGSYGGVLDAHYGAGRVAISLTPTSGVLLTEDCGTWTRLASEPPRYFEVIGSPTDPILLGGREAFFTGYSPPALSGTASAIMITAGPWTLDLKAPTGSNFIAGTQYNAVTLNESATTVGMYLRGLGRSCTNVSGSLRVLALETSGGSVTRFSALARQTCDGVGRRTSSLIGTRSNSYRFFRRPHIHRPHIHRPHVHRPHNQAEFHFKLAVWAAALTASLNFVGRITSG